ncbi:hypothetical protein BY996DRAFT_6427687 [Phakopsora pachyrhizi]|nr:hypothetical protein BY996DRAFT_6427687 [Phakopsora pachyrhizi]
MGDVTPALLNDSTIPINSDESKTDSVDKYDSSSTASDSSAEQINSIGAQSRIPEKENLSNERGSFRESESIPLTFKTPPKSFERLLTESSLPGLSQKEEGVGVAVFSENEELKAEPELIQNNDEKIVKVSDAQEASVEALGKTTDPCQTEDQISVNIDIGRKMSEILAYASKKLNISSNLMQLYLQPRDPSETTERLLSLELSAKEAGLINEDVLRIGQVKKDPAPASEVVAKDTADTKKFTPESKFTSKRRSEYDSQRASNIQSVILPTRSSSFLARARPITKPAAVRNTVSTEVKRKKGLPLPSAPNEKLKPNKTSNSETSNSEISNSEAFDMVDPNQKI